MLDVLGAPITDTLREKYARSPQWNNGRFENEVPTSLSITVKDMPRLFMKMIKPIRHREPKQPLPIVTIDPASIGALRPSQTRIRWFGHSAALLEIAGQTVLLDPMMGEVPAPFPLFVRKRYAPGLPIDAANLPAIDLVIMSHDHYDHLDYGTIRRIRDRTKRWVVSVGVGRHLEKWGVDPALIEEMDWFSSTVVGGITVACEPARHFSGRGLTNRHMSLWSSWVIKTDRVSLYFSADSGYADHFKSIGERHGPFDLALVECGQYNVQWQDIHMMPEESVQAAIDLNARAAMPIHWGAFSLAFHSWRDPVDRFTQQAALLGLTVTTPRIGEEVILGEPWPNARWWDTEPT